MARPRKYVIKLTDDELNTLKSIIRKSNTSKTIRSRCQIIIDLDEAHGKVLTHEQSARSNGVCLTTVTNTVTKYFSGGIEAVTEFKRNINSDNARRILDGRAEARIIELACGPVPEGHSRWTLRLLEKEAKVAGARKTKPMEKRASVSWTGLTSPAMSFSTTSMELNAIVAIRIKKYPFFMLSVSPYRLM